MTEPTGVFFRMTRIQQRVRTAVRKGAVQA